MTENKLIEHSFNLPNHDNELSQAESVIDKLKIKQNKLSPAIQLTDIEFNIRFDEIVNMLDYVGALSKSIFDIEENLEVMYTKQYSNAPALAKKLWFDHYESIHRPYTLLKNRCFKLLDDLDQYYIELYDRNPPNWKI